MESPMRSLKCKLALAVLAAMGIAPAICAQYTLTSGVAIAAPGESVSISVMLDNDDAVRGFSLGLTHDESVAVLVDILQGAALLATNGGDGADYFQIETDPANGPGGFIGCVISLSPPIEELAIGTSQELAIFQYTIAADAAPGSSASLDFSDLLGDPPVITVISNGSSFVPIQNSGSVDVITPPVVDLACLITDACTCDYALNWTNPMAYDAISIREDGVEIALLAGTETSFTDTLPAAGSATYAVVPIAGGLEGEASTCDLACSVPSPPVAHQMVCTPGVVSGLGCEFAFEWSGGDAYESAVLVLDGVTELATLDGADDPAVIALIPEGTHEICLTTTDSCGQDSTPECCTVDCVIPVNEPEFLRGDVSGTGGTNALVDALFLLNWQFNAGPEPPCFDAADVDDNGTVNALVDALFLLSWQFSGGPEPPAPGPSSCGFDGTPIDNAACATPPGACL